ncbi:hypothetical protein L2E82_27020 [Cichorium intybus]|uniref:Uncharacterized protein n=1 Tax=Cichorium intybus TaxID=13427 RepID=A0ACB9CRY0_CICIN|nr:hypothetical protein L2E82_27020 [Cichorium intybus]
MDGGQPCAPLPPPKLKSTPIGLVYGSPLLEWVKDKQTLIGELLSFDHLEKLPHLVTNGDGSLCEFKYLSGLRVWIRFASCRDRNMFIKSWTEWFCWVDSGDIAEQTYDRIAWLKIYGLPYEFWNEDNFTKIGESFGRVIVPYSMNYAAVDISFAKIGILSKSKSPINSESLVSISGQIVKVGVVEVDFDWSPFKKSFLVPENEQLSDDDGDDAESEYNEDEDGISDTVHMEEPEEGEIHEEEDDVVVEESIEAAGNTAGGAGAVCQAPVAPSGRTDVLDSNDKGNNDVRESQRSSGNISPHKENNCMGNLEKTNGSLGNDSTPRVDPIPCNRDIHILPPDNRLGSPSFGPIGILANLGCFGPFPSSKVMDQAELSSPNVGLNFSLGNSVGKRRRLLHLVDISPFDLSEQLNETQPIPPSFLRSV